MVEFTPPVDEELLPDFRSWLWTEWAEWNKTMVKLRNHLLSIDGKEVSPKIDSYAYQQLEHGTLMDPDETVVEQLLMTSHLNSIGLFLRDDANTEIGTGWVLDSDELWRRHSWVMRDETLVETTVPQQKYYGIYISSEAGARELYEAQKVDTNKSFTEFKNEVVSN